MYEIPQKLQWEEKIIFGLTYKQLAYAVIFGTPALTIFVKTNWHMFAKIIIAVFLISIGSLFMFFNLLGHLKNILHWIRFREAFLMDKKMKDFVGIERIENGIVYVKK